MLRKDFELFLQPNQVQRAVFDSWPSPSSWAQSAELIYTVLPGIRGYVKSQFSEEGYKHVSILDKILTFVGTDKDAEAASCKEYLTRRWVAVGLCWVNVLEDFLITSRPQSSMSPIIPTSSQKSDILVRKFSWAERIWCHRNVTS